MFESCFVVDANYQARAEARYIIIYISNSKEN